MSHFGELHMSIHWTDFPERVEKFGDLFSIYETLSQHKQFDLETFPDHAPNGAYSVEPRGRKWVVTPHPDQMPGLEPLLEVLEREGHYSLTLDLMRELRRRVMTSRNIDRAGVNAMTFHAVADVLNGAAQRGDPVPQPAGEISQECGVQTFGDLLANVQCVEQAAAATRAEADAMNGAPGSGHLRIQAAFYEADAEYKKHPAFPHLEAYVNLHYGPLTYANLLRVRGEICQGRGCGTMEADRLTIEEVVDLLRRSGAVPTSTTSTVEAALRSSQDAAMSSPDLPMVPADAITVNDIRIFVRALDTQRALPPVATRESKPSEIGTEVPPRSLRGGLQLRLHRPAAQSGTGCDAAGIPQAS